MKPKPLWGGNPKSSTPVPVPTGNPAPAASSSLSFNTLNNILITSGSPSVTDIVGVANSPTGTQIVVQTANIVNVAGVPTEIVLTAAPDITDAKNPNALPTAHVSVPSSSTVRPLMIGFGVVGLCFLVVLSVIYGIIIHQRTDHPIKPNVQIPKEILQVLYEYIPTMDDELCLSIGDFVEIEVKYDDGWARGLNRTTKKVGVFPLGACDRPF
ncbi:hypothetical protein HK103_001810 [Boothiomyces macroporosus]|uniref:SH3 domain-containing protein n=1 Tax=Boothiomyces macroporosus TaxID=261099 RepID=A0AAD5UAF9_9FUNG|nr:hypothetical protein HK103_001810 [Boothiomyces macroporosus]